MASEESISIPKRKVTELLRLLGELKQILSGEKD